MKKYLILLVLPLLLLSCGITSYAQTASSTTRIDGNKNPEKIPTHVAAFSWFNIAATNMNDAEHSYRFDQDLANTGVSEVDQGALKAIVSNFYEAYAKLPTAYNAKVYLGQVTSDDTHAFNKAIYLLALDTLAQTKQQLSPEGAKRFAAHIEAWKHRISMDPSTGSEVSR
ncbi:MAG TPA: hypothetical protein VGF61_03390 [Candidatus Acidoferrum sp.]